MLELRKCCHAALFSIFIAFSAQSSATLELPKLLSDGAVLQREHKIPIWGRAPANTAVSVTLGDSTRRVDSDDNGNWRVEFPALPAGGPLTLTVSAGKESTQIKDLYMGDVWVASGQSNMEFSLRNAEGGEAELEAADLPQVRHFKVPLTWAAVPQTELAGGQWQPAVKHNKGEFSAVAYFFAKKVHAKTGVPVGLIGTNWSGSSIEAWMSPGALGKSPDQTRGTIEQLVAESEQKTKDLRRTLQRWPGALAPNTAPSVIENARSDWSETELDTDDWLTLEAPSLWETQGYAGMDGVVWYRKTFTLGESDSRGPLVLSLGRIDDNDITWVNGHRVGSTDGYDLQRQYSVPAESLRPGVNTIAIRVEDAGGGGGIHSSPDLLYLEAADGERRSLAGSWKIKADRVALSPIGDLNRVDTALYNKMLHPLQRYPVKGVIWYQGESNADDVGEARRYAEQFQALIKDWRQGWGQPEMPFYWVQLANFNSGRNTEAGKPWAMVREAQTAALALPHTGQAVTIDVGNADDIHPRDKKTVGERLASIALNQTYGLEDVHYRGPVYAGVEARWNRLVVRFESAKPLAVYGGGERVQGFEVVTADGVTKAVDGKLEGRSVIIDAESPRGIIAIRYAWDDNPEDANLMDAAGLPAEPFRAPVSLTR